MKVLLDECCPAPLQNAITKFDLVTVEQAGMKGISNGELISAVEGKFDILVTADKNLRYQQQLTGRKISILELPTNSWPKLRVLLPAIEAGLARIQPGEYMIIQFEPTVL
jgi:hypothetical protein